MKKCFDRCVLPFNDSKYLSNVVKISYSVRDDLDPLTGESRLRVVVLYADGRIRALPPRFRDEKALEAYLERWNPELAGKFVDFLEMMGGVPKRAGATAA